MYLYLLCIVVCIGLVSDFCLFFFFKQKTAYEMRISDWSSDVCSSDLRDRPRPRSWIGQAWRASLAGAALYRHWQSAADAVAAVQPDRPAGPRLSERRGLDRQSAGGGAADADDRDRKSTRLNSSH